MTQDYTPATPAAQKRRLWTQEEIDIAQELRAAGWSYSKIGEALGRHLASVQAKLNPEKARERSSRWYKNNREQANEATRRWQRNNPERAREITRRWQENNPEKVKEISSRWYENNKERASETARCWRRNNPEKTRESARRWQRNNPERARELGSRWRKNNPEKKKECDRRYRKNYPEKRYDRERRRSALRRNRRKAALIKITLEAKARRFALFGNACAYCGLKPDRLTEDHILALTAGGLDEPDNIAPACASCNCSKNAKPVEAWYRSQPFFCEARWELIKQHCPGATGQLSLAMPA